MATQVRLQPSASTTVVTAGVPVIAAYGPVLGGFITNPATNIDQGIAPAAAEPLYLSILGAAAAAETATTFKLAPGQTFLVPPGLTSNVSVNANTNGHSFSAVVYGAPIQYPPTPPGGTFPPSGPTTVQGTIPSYLYQEYSDDDDLQAFVAAYNTIAQTYVNTFNQINLPIYTGPLIVGSLLDWVALGLYGFPRPTLSSGLNRNLGPLNTWALNTLAFNSYKLIGPSNVTVTTDDIFKRIITWNFFKGDGNIFDIRWLKRRIMRFLYGTNGINFNVSQTYQISVTFGIKNQVNINLISGRRTITGGAIFDRFALNTAPFNTIRSFFTPITPLPNAAVFKEALDSGVLQLPFQYDYVVHI